MYAHCSIQGIHTRDENTLRDRLSGALGPPTRATVIPRRAWDAMYVVSNGAIFG